MHDREAVPRRRTGLTALGIRGRVSVDDRARNERADEVADAIRYEVDETLCRRADAWPRLAVGVDLAADEEEIVTDAVQENPGENQPHARPGVAVTEGHVAQRPRRHAGEHDHLDAETTECKWQQEHEADFRPLSEGLYERRVRSTDLVEKWIGEGVVELKGNAQQKRPECEHRKVTILEQLQRIQAQRIAE